jgi:hypothetical protein
LPPNGKRDRTRTYDAGCVAQTLVVGEEKGLVTNDAAARCGAELIAQAERLAESLPVRKECARVEIVVAMELI